MISPLIVVMSDEKPLVDKIQKVKLTPPEIAKI